MKEPENSRRYIWGLVRENRDLRTQKQTRSMTTEALRTQLDAVNIQLEQLKVENARLRDDRPESAEKIDREAELAMENEKLVAEAEQCRQLYEQALSDTQEEQAAAGRREAG